MGTWPQEEEQLADGLVHDDPKEVHWCLILLVHGGEDPCQLHTFLNVATANLSYSMEQSKILGMIYSSYK